MPNRPHKRYSTGSNAPERSGDARNQAATVLRIDGPAHLGQGVGRLDGKVWMIPFSAVGDTVMAVPEKDHGSWIAGRLVSIAQPGPGRVEPFCPVYGMCGGCHLQHIDAQAERQWKTTVLRDVLERIARIEPGPVRYLAGSDRSCRCRVLMHAGGGRGTRDAGFFQAGSHRIVRPGQCPVAVEPVARLLEPIRQLVRNGGGAGDATIEPVCGADGKVVVVVNQESGDPTALCEAIAGLPGVSGVLFRGGRPGWRKIGAGSVRWPTAGLPGQVEYIDVDPRGFTQSHIEMNPTLVETVIGALGDGIQGMKVLELFAGSGNFTLGLAMRGASVVATDINAAAVRAAAEGFESRGLHVDHESGDIEDVLSRMVAGFGRPQAILADPPRSGLGRQAAAVAGLKADRVVLCSCEPSALARDLGPFLLAGYGIDEITLVDMFPQTYHMETVISLTFNRLCGESPFRSGNAKPDSDRNPGDLT